MPYKYLKKIKHGRSGATMPTYHLLRDDGKTAKCNMAVAGEGGYEVVEKKTKVLLSMTCVNCLQALG